MKMYGKEDCGSVVSIGGVEIPVADDGSVEVNPQLVDILRSHGFSDQPPLTPQKEGMLRKAKEKAISLFESAKAELAQLNAELLELEGRGDAELTQLKQAAVAKAEEAVTAAREELKKHGVSL